MIIPGKIRESRGKKGEMDGGIESKTIGTSTS